MDTGGGKGPGAIPAADMIAWARASYAAAKAREEAARASREAERADLVLAGVIARVAQRLKVPAESLNWAEGRVGEGA